MAQNLLAADGWPALLARLPASLDLAATAREHAALVRARGVPSAAALLRLALVYANTPLSLRGTAAWAAAAGVAELSDVALLGRLRRAEAWLEAVLGHLLAARLTPPPGARVVEPAGATGLAAPGGRPGAAWRVHASFDLARARFRTLRLTPGTEAETLARFAPAAGTVLAADRHYAKAEGVLSLAERRASLVVRCGMTGCALLDDAGRRIGLRDVLAREAEPPDRLELAVSVPRPGGAAPLPARLVLRRLPPDAAAGARARARRKAGRRGTAAGPRRLASAGRLAVLATLDPGVPAGEVLALYRLRWRLELAFKRLKSQLRLDDLRAEDPRLARATLLAKLVLAAPTDRVLGEALALSPPRPGPPALALAPHPPGAHGPARRPARRAAPRRPGSAASTGSAATSMSRRDDAPPGSRRRGGSHLSADGDGTLFMTGAWCEATGLR